jgi:YD repeat-containing protein
MRLPVACWALAFVAVASLCCSRDLDCRHKGQECGAGFACQKDDAGKWECLPAAAAAAPGNAGAAASAGARRPDAAGEDEERRVTCPDHLLCPADAIECECSGRGQLLALETDRDRDGAADFTVRLTRDERGLVQAIEIDEGADGTADEVHSYSYESRGNPLQHEVRRPAGGDGAGVRVTYLYDGNAQLTAMRVDEELDGKLDFTCTYEPPCPPPLPNATCAPDCDPAIPASQVFTMPCPRHPKCTGSSAVCRCDAYGDLLLRELDLDGDGHGDEAARFAYDRQGKLIAAVVDEGVDGSEDVRHLYAYDERGMPIAWDVLRKSKADSRRIEYAYDENGDLILETLDQGRDGKVNRRCRHVPPCPPPIPNPACKPVCE